VLLVGESSGKALIVQHTTHASSTFTYPEKSC
jgi:hypothetical protein